jgi:cell division protein FtsL
MLLWGTAIVFLFAALYTVAVRREVYDEARRIGVLERRVREERRRNENGEIERERLASPGAILERARAMGLVEAEGAPGR